MRPPVRGSRPQQPRGAADPSATRPAFMNNSGSEPNSPAHPRLLVPRPGGAHTPAPPARPARRREVAGGRDDEQDGGTAANASTGAVERGPRATAVTSVRAVPPGRAWRRKGLREGSDPGAKGCNPGCYPTRFSPAVGRGGDRNRTPARPFRRGSLCFLYQSLL